MLKRVNLTKELDDRGIVDCRCKFVEWNSGDDIVRGLEGLLKIKGKTKYIRFCKDSYYSETIMSVLNCSIKEVYRNIELIEEDEDTFVEIETVIEKDNSELVIIVRLSDEKDFIYIRDITKNEILYQW